MKRTRGLERGRACWCTTTQHDRIGPTAKLIGVRQRLVKEIERRNHWISVVLKTKGERVSSYLQLSTPPVFIRSIYFSFDMSTSVERVATLQGILTNQTHRISVLNLPKKYRWVTGCVLVIAHRTTSAYIYVIFLRLCKAMRSRIPLPVLLICTALVSQRKKGQFRVTNSGKINMKSFSCEK
jgi:hypothetical protein